MVSTIVIRYKLHPENSQFMEWKKKMNAESQKAAGFLDRIELPLIARDPYHSVILRFDSKMHAEKWLNSPIRKSLLSEVDAIAEERIEKLHENNSFWFGISSEKASKKWKQVFVSFLAVYPLTQIIPYLIKPILERAAITSTLFTGMIIGLLISTCMVYFAMPIVLNLFKRWLKP